MATVRVTFGVEAFGASARSGSAGLGFGLEVPHLRV